MAPQAIALAQTLFADYKEQGSAEILAALQAAQQQATAAEAQFRAAMAARDAATDKALDDAEAKLKPSA